VLEEQTLVEIDHLSLIQSRHNFDASKCGRILISFSMGQLFYHLKGTRCKPWDDRELDLLEGFKVLSFFLATVGNTAYMFAKSALIDAITVLRLFQSPFVTAFIAALVGFEVFFFISAFLTSYRCFMIMEAKGECLSIVDILKIYARKWVRLAPCYYAMWLFLWGLTARIGSGFMYNVTDGAYA